MYICTYLIALLIPVSPRCEEALDCVAGSFAFRRSWMPRWSYYRLVVTNKPEGSSCTGYVRRRRQFHCGNVCTGLRQEDAVGCQAYLLHGRVSAAA